MDKAQRNVLRKVITDCREVLETAIAEVLQGHYGIHADGTIESADGLPHLDASAREGRDRILAHLRHVQGAGFELDEAVTQLVREVAFTHLNRFCAYKAMEARGLIREAVSRGPKSQGFMFYLADHPDDEALWSAGQQDVAYRHYLEWLSATCSAEIGALFAPQDPANDLFPPYRALTQVLELINSEELASVWDQDETIGWVYQYFTPKELREHARSESSAPRNAYELAFRNQFYTPRYVVQFLSENTLGRLWYEMRRGQTEVTDACPYLVYRPTEVFLEPGETPPDSDDTETRGVADGDDRAVYVPDRPKKDPREIKVLDPACGSGHFLLYCFDLLEGIYAEAYDDPDLGPDLQAEYGSFSAFERAIPQLILRHNLHGVDIDLRATQIAGLALWLRTQRFYAEREIPRDDRPAIRRANVVCAEPMPGETSMLEEFLETLEGERLRELVSDALGLAPDQAPRVTSTMAESLRSLVRTVWGQMELASEAGSLLQVDEALQEAIDEGRREWEEQLPLLRVTELSLTEQPQERYYRFVPEEADTFWAQAERIVDVALRDYIEHATNGRDYQRRLFAEDALQGFAFIDLCRQSYDVVLMNPPFGKPSKPSKAYIDKTYPRTKNDVYAAFVERGLQWLQPGGLLGAITSRTGFFLSSFQTWREEILLGEAHPTVFADLGYGVLDTAMVETAAYCLAKR